MILRQGRLSSTQKGARFPPAWHIFFRKMIAWTLARITEGHKAQPSCWECSQISQHGKSQTHEKLVFCYSAIHSPPLKCCLLGNTVSTVANLLLSSCLVKFVKRARWQRLVCYTLSQSLGIPPLVSDVETPRDTRTPRLGWGPADTNSTTGRDKQRGGFWTGHCKCKVTLLPPITETSWTRKSDSVEGSFAFNDNEFWKSSSVFFLG